MASNEELLDRSNILQGGKVKNPWPNVDAHSGVLLNYYGYDHDHLKVGTQALILAETGWIKCSSTLFCLVSLAPSVSLPN